MVELCTWKETWSNYGNIATLLCANLLLDHPDHERARTMANRMLAESGSEATRMMLQVALLYGRTEYAPARKLCDALVEAHGRIQPIRLFCKTLSERVRRVDLGSRE